MNNKAHTCNITSMVKIFSCSKLDPWTIYLKHDHQKHNSLENTTSQNPDVYKTNPPKPPSPYNPQLQTEINRIVATNTHSNQL